MLLRIIFDITLFFIKNVFMEIPMLKEKKLTHYYPILMTADMKKSLVELKTFKNIDVPNWIRQMIQKGLDELSQKNDTRQE